MLKITSPVLKSRRVAVPPQVDMKSDERKQLGRIMLKGDTITLMQSM